MAAASGGGSRTSCASTLTLRACVPGNGGVFLCGHPGMISGARAIMRRAGFDDKAIREEQYWPD